MEKMVGIPLLLTLILFIPLWIAAFKSSSLKVFYILTLLACYATVWTLISLFIFTNGGLRPVNPYNAGQNFLSAWNHWGYWATIASLTSFIIMSIYISLKNTQGKDNLVEYLFVSAASTLALWWGGHAIVQIFTFFSAMGKAFG